jgi:hypothetical protein
LEKQRRLEPPYVGSYFLNRLIGANRRQALISRRLAEVCSAEGFRLPVVSTPRELMAV